MNQPELAALRTQIDAIDEKLIALLKERISVVGKVGELKHATAPGICPIRPGREGSMVRDIVEKFQDSPFQPSAAAAIWRIIIGASTGVEAPLNLSVLAPDKETDLLWMAREYFGPTATITRQPHVNRVIGDVKDGKCSIGIVPMPRGSDTSFWWSNLLQTADAPRIFARLPFVHTGTPAREAPSALAIAKLEPEDSGNDATIIVIEADENASQSRLQTAFANAKLEANWISVATLAPGARQHLIELQGFITSDHKALNSVKLALAGSIFKTHILGTYPVPLILNVNK